MGTLYRILGVEARSHAGGQRLSLSNAGSDSVCRQTRKASFSRRECTLMVLDQSEKRSLTQYHGKLNHSRVRDSMERACASSASSRASRATREAERRENSGEAAMMLVRLVKVCTDRAEAKRAVPSVGST